MRQLIILILILLATVNVFAADQVVTDNGDPGAVTLRQAIADVGSGEEITFNLSSGNETITLSSNLTINKNLTINGDLQDEGGSFNASSGSSVVVDGNIKNANSETKLVKSSSGGLIITGDIDVEQ